jgi:prevent-host-death family protein
VTPAAPHPISARTFRANLARTLRRVAADGEYVVVTRRGVPVAAVVPVGLLDLLEAAEGLLARQTLAGAGDVHDVASAAADVPPRAPSITGPNARPRVCRPRRADVSRPE